MRTTAAFFFAILAAGVPVAALGPIPALKAKAGEKSLLGKMATEFLAM